MLNYEKYMEEINNCEDIGCFLADTRGVSEDCIDENCDECLKKSLKFLFSEYKDPIKLTHDEIIILKNIDKKYKYITRDKDNSLHIYENKPYKDGYMWIGSVNFILFRQFNHLFQFIKWEDEEPYSIKEILDNYIIE